MILDKSEIVCQEWCCRCHYRYDDYRWCRCHGSHGRSRSRGHGRGYYRSRIVWCKGDLWLFAILLFGTILLQLLCTSSLAFTLPLPFAYSSLSIKNLLNSVLLASNANLAGGGRNLKSAVLEDASLITPKLIRKYGHPSETHTIVTKDGYILEVHRIPKKGAQPVLLMHGILDTSATWILMGVKSGLGYILSDLGYDVWMGNARGNRYSKNHTSLNSDYVEFWDFTFHEMGKYDLPAIIDYILSNTGYQQLHYIGHSQGTAVFWVLCSEQPQYTQKVLSMHALAPIAYIADMKSPLFRTLVLFLDFFTAASRMLRITEFMPNTKFLVDHSQLACHDNAMTQDVCSNVLFLVAGYNSEQLNKTMLPVMLSHTPSGASIKQLEHFGQLMKSGHFRKFDRGYVRNQLEYNRITPPDYDLSKVKVPVALYYSMNDMLVSTTGVDRLARELPQVIDKYLVPMEQFNHLDFLWAIDVKTLVYNRLIRNLRRVENVKLKHSLKNSATAAPINNGGNTDSNINNHNKNNTPKPLLNVTPNPYIFIVTPNRVVNDNDDNRNMDDAFGNNNNSSSSSSSGNRNRRNNSSNQSSAHSLKTAATTNRQLT